MRKFFTNLIFLTLGAFIAAFAIESILVPNKIIDGGVVGISIMMNYKTKLPLGLYIFVLNLPFIFLALQKMGKLFVLSTFYAVAMLSVGVSMIPIWTGGRHVTDPFLACIFGGVILGLGVGLILRNNGSLDGTEIVALHFAKKLGFSVGEIVMFFNLFIFTAAGVVFENWQSAMYSIIAYFITYRVIDIVIDGLNESKSIRIISDLSQEIGSAIMEQFDVSVTYIDATGGFSGQKKRMIYCIISRLEIMKLKALIKTIDPSAFIAVENVHEVDGVRIKSHKGI